MRAQYGLSWMGLVLLALYLTTVTVEVPAHAASPARIKSVLLLSRSARVLESCPVVDFTHSLIKNQAGTWTIRWDQVTQTTQTRTGTVEWVDVHVTRTSGTEHYRMWQSPLSSSPNRAVMVYTFENPNNLLTPGEIISYSFTIKSDIACDTQLYTETVPLAATTLSPTTTTCPAIQFSSSVADGKIYFTPTSPSPAINWVDVHIQHALTRAATHSHHRMTLSASSTPSAPMFEAAIPSDVAAQFAYSFTYSAGNIQCDTTGFTHNGGSTTEPTNVNPAPTNPPAPSSTVCPAVEFGHTIVGSINNNNGETTNTIYFDVVLPKLATYVEVHITHNGAQYNYRMTLHETNSYSTVYKFVQPQFLNWTPGQSVSYFFTYLATELGIQCDTPVYTLTEG